MRRKMNNENTFKVGQRVKALIDSRWRSATILEMGIHKGEMSAKIQYTLDSWHFPKTILPLSKIKP